MITSSRFALAALAAGALAAALPACKKDEPVAPASSVVAPSQVGTPLTKPDTPPGRTPVPPSMNPARNVKGQVARPLGANLAKIRPFAPTRTTKLGTGTVTVSIEGAPPQTTPINVYRRGKLVILSSDQPTVGLVLTLPTLAAGRYARGAGAAAAIAATAAAKLPLPNLRVRIGAAHRGLHLQAAAQDDVASLAVDVTAGQGAGSASGTFEGVVAQHGGQNRRKVTGGRFDVQVDNTIPGVAEVFSLEHALRSPNGELSKQ